VPEERRGERRLLSDLRLEVARAVGVLLHGDHAREVAAEKVRQARPIWMRASARVVRSPVVIPFGAACGSS